jgi:hypothetical protein
MDTRVLALQHTADCLNSKWCVSYGWILAIAKTPHTCRAMDGTGTRASDGLSTPASINCPGRFALAFPTGHGAAGHVLGCPILFQLEEGNCQIADFAFALFLREI